MYSRVGKTPSAEERPCDTIESSGIATNGPWGDVVVEQIYLIYDDIKQRKAAKMLIFVKLTKLLFFFPKAKPSRSVA